MQEIYLDNSATTRPDPLVVKAMQEALSEVYGNPSSLHEKGIAAERLITAARRELAALIKADEKEIVFTSGGTEANNLAIIGAARRNQNRGRHLVTSTIEHPSVLNSFRYLDKAGFRVSHIPVDSSGLLSVDSLAEAIGEDTILVSVMHVNNELGTIEPLEELGRVVKTKNPDTLFHVDAVQSLTKVPLDLHTWQADMATFSAHKMHGPKGAGALWIKSGVRLEPILHGGGQESGIRSGTENSSAIVGFGRAAKLAAGRESSSDLEKLRALKRGFYEKLLSSKVPFSINGPCLESGAPHILNLSFPGLKAEVILHSLEEKKIYVSAGSACHSRHPEPSHVLKAINLPTDRLGSAIRFSFSVYDREEEVEHAADETAAVIRSLRSFLA